MKLYETISDETGASFEVRGTKLQLRRLDLEVSYQFEKLGYLITELDKLFAEKPIEVSSTLGFLLLTDSSKEDVGGSITTFRKCLNSESLADLVEAITKTIEDSQVVTKKPKAKAVKK